MTQIEFIRGIHHFFVLNFCEDNRFSLLNTTRRLGLSQPQSPGLVTIVTKIKPLRADFGTDLDRANIASLSDLILVILCGDITLLNTAHRLEVENIFISGGGRWPSRFSNQVRL